ncbi:riboflavin synthase [Clostridium oceanicum]|uniref:Riboflavin synthase n=1 Tax=Clostridium oceanicum TaxID=1543 RepID=A0ABP3V5B0_9CLOT
MFTGIVEEIGKILSIKNGSDFLDIEIEGDKVLDSISLGDSIAVNGVCLTVTKFDKKNFTVDVMAETMRKSNLKFLKKNSLVNLERALTLNKPLGGHMVSGHIDGVGKIIDVKKEGIATIIYISSSKDILSYIVKKGSVALNGVSLTVVDVTEKYFSVSLIPHTKKETTLIYNKKGDEINIECDVIGKYIFKFLNSKENKDKKIKTNIDENFLNRYGFL